MAVFPIFMSHIYTYDIIFYNLTYTHISFQINKGKRIYVNKNNYTTSKFTKEWRNIELRSFSSSHIWCVLLVVFLKGSLRDLSKLAGDYILHCCILTYTKLMRRTHQERSCISLGQDNPRKS